jgi:RND family efflux transporter MFP subunit
MSRVKTSVLVGLLALLLVLPGCVDLAEDQPTPTPIPTPAESNKPIYEVKTGSIIQTVKALGRVAASQEDILYFKQTGRLRRLYVDTNQKVKKGDLLAELETGNLRTQIAQAKLDLDMAQIKLAQAMKKSGSESGAVAQAKASLEKAEGDYAKANGEVEKLKTGALDADLRTAEQGVAAAEAAYGKAQTELTRLKNGPTPEDIRAAELDIERARNTLWSKQINRDANCGRGPGPSCDSSNADVASGETAVTTANLALEKLKSPAKPEDVANAEKNVTSAKAALDAARARSDSVKSGAKNYEVVAADRSAASAKAALDSARANYDQTVAMSAQGGDYDVQLQQKQVEYARVSLQVLEDQLDLALIKATFDGTVVATAGREGEQVNAYTPIVTIANPQSIQLAVELQATDLSKVQLGQEVTVVFTAFPTEKIVGKVAYMPSITAGSDPQLPANQRTVKLDFESPKGKALELGALANITIATQKKDGVLILPNTAIRAFGGRKFVRISAPGGRKQEVDVEIGISNETDTEIVKGVREGQQVIGQ